MSFLDGYQSILTGGLVIISFGLIIWVGVLSRKIRQQQQEREDLLGKKSEDLGAILEDQAKRIKRVEADVEEIYQVEAGVEKELKKVISGVGVVRYNPFDDSGGNQSFVVGFLNKSGDGVVVSSLHSREGTRVYAKPIVAGESKFKLSAEEEKALAEAARNMEKNGD